MANLVKQFRYYNDPDETDDITKNYPADATSDDYKSGDIFKPYFPILQLGIQALPGTEFLLNDAEDPVIIGRTGIYELDLDEETEISKLQFTEPSIYAIRDNFNAYLIVDIIYDDGEEK